MVFTIPAPPNTAQVNLNPSMGKAKYAPGKNAIVWKIKTFNGGAEYQLRGDAVLSVSASNKAWTRPPIQVSFNVPMFTASGLHVRFLKVFEKTAYQTTKWVRYITNAGNYQIRIANK